MDKNTFTGLLLIAAVMFGFMYCNRRNAEQQAAQMTEQTQEAAKEMAAQKEAEAQNLIPDSVRYGDFVKYVGGTEQSVTINNEVMNVTFSSKGGRIAKVVLPKYKTETTGKPADITLMDGDKDAYNLEFETANQRFNTADLNFDLRQVNDSTVIASMNLDNGAQLALRYTVVPGQYLVRMSMEQKNMDRIIPANRSSMRFKWNYEMHRNEVGRRFEEQKSQLKYMEGDGIEELSERGENKEQAKGNVRWVAFKNQFFSAGIIADKPFAGGELTSEAVSDDPVVLKTMSMDAPFAYSSKEANPASFTFFFTPNLYPYLSGLDDVLAPHVDNTDLHLTKLVELGWGLFGWINRFVTIPVFSWLSTFITNYGIIILILTFLVKIVLFPLTYKSYRSQARMRLLAPEINEINEKYPGQENAAKRSQETMKLYSRAGASPFSGCLPMLLQMPVLIALFWFFPSAIELRGQSFLWAHDLAAPDYICTLPFTIPWYGNHVSLFCLLMTVTNILYTRINMQNQPTTTQAPGMKWMMYLMPVMFLFWFNDYASGLSYYYFLSLLITIVQTYLIRYFTDEEKVRAEMIANAKKPRKAGGFMARLEKMQKQQEAMMREQARKNARRK